MFPGGVPGATGHHWSTVACTYGSAVWKGLNAGAKAIAASTIDYYTHLTTGNSVILSFVHP